MRTLSLGVVGFLVAVAALAPAVDQVLTGRLIAARIERLAEPGGPPPDLANHAVALTTSGPAAALASWQTIGGCGAGASAGGGVGLKWVGRNVTGGLFHVEAQSSYTKLDDGYLYGFSTMVGRDLGDKWSLAVSVPWQYKYWRDPYGLGFDLSNQGLGDVNALLTRKLGSLNATTVTLSIGAPTGDHKAKYMEGDALRQDKQMGHGRYTGGLVVDHTIDRDWGLIVLGGSFDYRGGTNELKSVRKPSGGLYAHVAYLLGPFAPAFGITSSKAFGEDYDQDRKQEDATLLTIAPTVSIEWATDWFALLVGGSLPYNLKGERERTIFSAGLALSPF